MSKFDKLFLQCSKCNSKVFFELIDEIECDWGSHRVIQCPECEDLFSIDHACPAFSNLLDLIELNSESFNPKEKSDYLRRAHPC